MEVNNDLFNPVLEPEAKALALKLEAFLKSKEGNLLVPVKIKGNKESYYWSIMEKKFVLIHGGAELYLVPWKETENGEFYIYSPYNFQQGNIFTVPKDEIVFLGFN